MDSFFFFCWSGSVFCFFVFYETKNKWINRQSNISTGDHSFSFGCVGRCVTLKRHLRTEDVAHRNTLSVFRVISAPVSNNHSRVNVCTPTSLARVWAFLGRAQTTTTRVKEGERRRARRSKGRNGVWEKWKEEGGPGIGSANRNSPETGDELQKWDLRQMPSFSKELRPSAPLENTVIREGEAGVCQAQDLSVCMCVCVFVGWHWDTSHVTEHDPEVQPSDCQYVELNTAAASERKGSNCLQSNRFLFT